MATYFEPVLSEEQLAAYLDGMLSPEESNVVEEIIASDPEMEEIMETIDSVDSAFIYETDEEIPIECLADDFSLPDMNDDYQHPDESYTPDDFSEDGCDDGDFQNGINESDYQDESSIVEHDDEFLDNSFDDISF